MFEIISVNRLINILFYHYDYKKNVNKYLFIYLTGHLLIWTLIPTVVNTNLPLDTIEALAWGSDLKWGFEKHPPMSGLMVEIIFQLFGNNDWAFYFLSQIFLIFTFLIVWKFSNEIFRDKTLSLISVLMLSGFFSIIIRHQSLMLIFANYLFGL